MTTKRPKWTVLVCLLASSVFAVACDDNEDMTAQQVSETQAEAVLGSVVGGVIEFSLGVMQLVQAAASAAPPVAASTQGATCSPCPGVETEFLCTDPDTGTICPTSAMSSTWQFTNCVVEGDTTTLDGTVMVAGTGPYNLHFDVTIDGQDVDGNMTIAFGTCNAATYDNLMLHESGVTATLVGTFDDCGDGAIDATIESGSFQTFLAEIVANDGFALITVIDGQSHEPLYTCSWSPITPDAAECVPYTGGV